MSHQHHTNNLPILKGFLSSSMMFVVTMASTLMFIQNIVFIESSLSLSLSKLEILSSIFFIILMFVLDNFHLREDNHSQKNRAFPKDHGCTHQKTMNHVLQDNVTMFPRK
jgi:hypothetical protein